MNGSPAAKAQFLLNLFLSARFVFLPAFSPCCIALLFGNDLRIVRQTVFLQLLSFLSCAISPCFRMSCLLFSLWVIFRQVLGISSISPSQLTDVRSMMYFFVTFLNRTEETIGKYGIDLLHCTVGRHP